MSEAIKSIYERVGVDFPGTRFTDIHFVIHRCGGVRYILSGGDRDCRKIKTGEVSRERIVAVENAVDEIKKIGNGASAHLSRSETTLARRRAEQESKRDQRIEQLILSAEAICSEDEIEFNAAFREAVRRDESLLPSAAQKILKKVLS